MPEQKPTRHSGKNLSVTPAKAGVPCLEQKSHGVNRRRYLPARGKTIKRKV